MSATQSPAMPAISSKRRARWTACKAISAGIFAKNEAPKLSASEDYFLKKVRKAVDAHLDEPTFSVEDLCREVGISHAQLHRKLSALTGLCSNKFIRSVRLRKAQELLRNPAVSITSVAMDAGFSDASYFGKVFRQEFGMTLMEWRELNFSCL